MYVLAAFPGCGKSTMADEHPQISDSDSSQFDKAEFPGNYIAHIKGRERAHKPTLVSTHETVREALVAANIPFILVYPALECKDEYVKRYRDRAGTGKHGNKNNEDWFADLVARSWHEWVVQCREQKGCLKVELQPGQFLSDVVSLHSGEFMLTDKAHVARGTAAPKETGDGD